MGEEQTVTSKPNSRTNTRKKWKLWAFISLFCLISGLFLFLLITPQKATTSMVEDKGSINREPPAIPQEYVYVKAQPKDPRPVGRKVLDEGTKIGYRATAGMRKGSAEPEGVQYPVLRIYGGENAITGPNGMGDTGVEILEAPFGRLISCETILTLDSNEGGTPILGYVTEDVCHEGEVFIPAGTEVHGAAGSGFIRDRIQASGEWIFVWRNLGENCGKELRLHGIALDHDKDDSREVWGITDGSIGIRGETIEPGESKEFKLMVSQLVSGLTSGFMSKEKHSSTVGITTERSKGGIKNALLSGGGELLETYGQTLLQKLEAEKPFVRVPAGKQFYIYVTQRIRKNV